MTWTLYTCNKNLAVLASIVNWSWSWLVVYLIISTFCSYFNTRAYLRVLPVQADHSLLYSAKLLAFVFCGEMALSSEVHLNVPTNDEEGGEVPREHCNMPERVFL